MIPVMTRRGRKILIISAQDLVRPVRSGKYVRSFCPIHGGDHTRSLSVHASGWGFCFNAACSAFSATFEATVLVAEWSPEAADNLLRWNRPGKGAAALSQASGQARGSNEYAPPPEFEVPQALPAVDPPRWQQDELLALFRVYEAGFLQAQLGHPLSQAYLDGRGTPMQVARMTGMGYLPRFEEIPRQFRWDGSVQLPSWWCNRIIFPVGVWWPDGTTRLGFSGRSLQGWRPGMNDQEHKSMLELPGMPRRWRKTWPHGWFGYEPAELGRWVVLVEGPFDRCALLAAGFHQPEVIALVGTGARAYWLPDRVTTVVLALDGDAGGENATAQLVGHLERDGRAAICCRPPRDGEGKDWSERWARAGPGGLAPLLAIRTRFRAE